MTDSTPLVEKMARAICVSDGRDPDELAPIHEICGPNNEPVPWWNFYTEFARAALDASGNDELVEALKPFAELAGKFSDCVVEICAPHPDNPSPHIQPFDPKHFDKARAAIATTQEPEQ